MKSCESLVDRGILTRGKTQFAFHTTLLGFHHDVADTGVHTGPHAMSQKVKDLWGDFFYNEWSVNWVNMASERKKTIAAMLMRFAVGNEDGREWGTPSLCLPPARAAMIASRR